MILSLFGTRSRCLLPNHLRRAYHAACPPISGGAVKTHLYKRHAKEHVGIGYPAVMMLTVTRDGSTDNNSLSDSHSFLFFFGLTLC